MAASYAPRVIALRLGAPHPQPISVGAHGVLALLKAAGRLVALARVLLPIGEVNILRLERLQGQNARRYVNGEVNG
jgi:hypothetical protein